MIDRQLEKSKNPSLETDLFEMYKGQATQLDIDIDLMKKEQGYSSKNFFASLNSIDHDLFSDQTLEELLSSLTA